MCTNYWSLFVEVDRTTFDDVITRLLLFHSNCHFVITHISSIDGNIAQFFYWNADAVLCTRTHIYINTSSHEIIQYVTRWSGIESPLSIKLLFCMHWESRRDDEDRCEFDNNNINSVWQWDSTHYDLLSFDGIARILQQVFKVCWDSYA